MWNWIKNLFKPKEPGITGKVIKFENHKTWGDNIEIWDRETNRLVGWLTPIPDEGDLITISDKYYLITDVESTQTVEDMFFCTVKRYEPTETDRAKIRNYKPKPYLGFLV